MAKSTSDIGENLKVRPRQEKQKSTFRTGENQKVRPGQEKIICYI